MGLHCMEGAAEAQHGYHIQSATALVVDQPILSRCRAYSFPDSVSIALHIVQEDTGRYVPSASIRVAQPEHVGML